MQTESYLGYVGQYVYDPVGELFYGHVLGIDELITFQGIYNSEMQAAFEEAVDEYLEMCRELGIRPGS